MRVRIDCCYAITHNSVMDTATDILRKLRSAGLSQSEIARKTGIPQPRLSRWEGGSTPAGANDALRLAALLREMPGGRESSEVAHA
ncbi:helix-turn-helix domain-containing protein [Parapusillimonas sp. JC17]|uniref:helix-turn-helix domain-containing protein n=1 Tax=Parapusillimonas sp. JC17 TaxID=3445768 RepID=UPI003F9F06DF